MSHLLVVSNTNVHRRDSQLSIGSPINNRKSHASSCKTNEITESNRNKHQIGINLFSAALVAISIFFINLNVVTRANEEHAAHWSYMDQKTWNETYPQCVKNGRRQSPINIITGEVIPAPLNISLINYDQEVEFKIKNTHHSVSMQPVAPNPDMAPMLKLNWLNESEAEFELVDIHFHWGDHNKKGSEHLLDGERFEAEMHMVHFRKGVNHSQVGSIPNSLVVIGVFIKSEPSDNNKFSGIVWGTQKVNGTDEPYTTENNDIINLLPKNTKDFYTYQGSLTTPPCYEIVTWVVMAEPVYMGRNQLSELADLYADEHDKGMKRIAPNFREPNELSGRKVYSSMFANATDTDPHSNEIPQSGNKTDQKKIHPQNINIQTIDNKRLSQVLNQLGRQASIYRRNNGRGRSRANGRRRRS